MDPKSVVGDFEEFAGKIPFEGVENLGEPKNLGLERQQRSRVNVVGRNSDSHAGGSIGNGLAPDLPFG